MRVKNDAPRHVRLLDDGQRLVQRVQLRVAVRPHRRVQVVIGPEAVRPARVVPLERLDVMVLAPGGHCIDMPCDEMERFVATLRRVDLYGRTLWTLGKDYLRRVYGADWRTFRYQWKPPETAAP